MIKPNAPVTWVQLFLFAIACALAFEAGLHGWLR